MTHNESPNRSNLAVGIILIAIGAVFLLRQYFSLDLFGSLSWPFYVIVPGLLFLVAWLLGGPSANGLAVPGTFITIAGLILLYQNSTGHWTSWAYAWALLIPTSFGLAEMLQGMRSNRIALTRTGMRTAGIGLVIFVIGWAFFEVGLNLGGFVLSGIGNLGRIIGPLLLIGIGVYVLSRRSTR